MTRHLPSMAEVAEPFGPRTDKGIRGMQDPSLKPKPTTIESVQDEVAGFKELELDEVGLQALVAWCADNGLAADQIEAVERLFAERNVPSQDTVS